MGKQYKIKDIVKVYEDPITKEKLEGTAQIVSINHIPNSYMVKFKNESVAVFRTVY